MELGIELSPSARDHLEALRKRDQQIVADAIEIQLTWDADKPTRNRKRLQDNPLAPWELRVGSFRVFYDVDMERKVVVVVAIGRKIHNRLLIGGEEIEL
jgi:mRNA-degrading endonuclease RelE of RelBE toxin-antitoxin system